MTIMTKFMVKAAALFWLAEIDRQIMGLPDQSPTKICCGFKSNFFI